MKNQTHTMVSVNYENKNFLLPETITGKKIKQLLNIGPNQDLFTIIGDYQIRYIFDFKVYHIKNGDRFWKMPLIHID